MELGLRLLRWRCVPELLLLVVVVVVGFNYNNRDDGLQAVQRRQVVHRRIVRGIGRRRGLYCRP